MLRVPYLAPGFAGRAASILRNGGTRACRDAGTRLTEVKNCVITYFMYGNGGNLLFEVDSSGVKREYGYVAGKNIAKKETR